MRIIWTAVLVGMIQISFAQSIPWNARVSSFSELEKVIPAIASRLATTYHHPDPVDQLDNLLRIQLVAGLYEASMSSLDSLQRLLGIANDSSLAAMGLQFRSYAATMIHTITKKENFEYSYPGILSALYDRLPKSAKPMAESSFSSDTSSYVKALQELFASCQGKAEVDVSTAFQLVKNWNSLNVQRHILQPAKDFFEKEEEKNYIVQDSFLIKGQNGAEIGAVIVRPKGIEGKAPAVLVHNIYAGTRDKGMAKLAASKGYAGIVINTRGKWISKNSIEPLEHDGEDINTVLDWLNAQDWFNGKAGMYGGSYLGFSQWAATKKKIHPALKTIVPQVAVGAAIDFPMFNGIPYGYILQWLHYVTNNKLTDIPEFSNAEKWKSLFIKWYQLGLPYRKLDSLEGRPLELFQRWLDHPEIDGYWQSMIPYDEEFKKIDIPILTITGYFDDDQRGAMHYYTQHTKWNPSAEHFLFIGPYDHYGAQSNPSELVLGYAIDSVAKVSINELVWDWFDYTLRNGKKPVQLSDRVNYQAMGTNSWKSAKDLQSISNDSIVLYMSHKYSGKGFLLSKKWPVNETWLEHVTDFKERSVVDYKMMALSKNIPHQRENLVFISEPLKEDVMMNGSLKGKMEMILNKKDADLIFELYELMPDSNYFQLSNTNQRISFILNPRKRNLLVPGKRYSIPVYNSFMTSRLLHKGSRLVLYAGPMKDFGYELNYGTGKPVSEESLQDALDPLIIKWSNRSYITIPILK